MIATKDMTGEDVIRLAGTGRYAEIRELAADGFDFNFSLKDHRFPDSYRCPLDTAIWAQDEEMVQLLLDSGASPNHLSGRSNKCPVIITAVSLDYRSIPKMMLWYGGNPSLPDRFGWTALHQAVDRADYDFIELALEKGGDINSQTRDGNSPLHVAAWYASCITDFLLEKGADPNAVNAKGHMPRDEWGDWRDGDYFTHEDADYINWYKYTPDGRVAPRPFNPIKGLEKLAA
jgi:ankyrin repeat protein